MANRSETNSTTARLWHDRLWSAVADLRPMIEAASAEAVDDATAGDAAWRLLFFFDGSVLMIDRRDDGRKQFVELAR